MKLKNGEQLTVNDVDKAWDLTQEIYDIYVNSEEVKDMTVNSELIGGVLTIARASFWTAKSLENKLKKIELQRNIFIGSTVILASYYVYNKFVKNDKVIKKK